MKKILVKLPYMLGDSIIASVFLQALPEVYPDSTVDIILNKNLRGLEQLLPHVHHTHFYDKKEYKGPLRQIRFGREIRAQSGVYDIYFCLHHSFSSALTALFTLSKKRVGFRVEGRRWLLTHSYQKPKEVVHRADDCMILLRKFSGKNVHHKPFSFHYEQQLPFELPAGFNIVFNPNSGGKNRTISVEKSVSIIQDIREKIDGNIILTGTKKEQQHIGHITDQLPQDKQIVDLSGKTSLLDLAMVLKSANLVISADTGTARLANAFGTPDIVFFGNADHRKTRPFNKENLIVLRKKDLPCAPCIPRKRCKFSELRCITEIPNKALLEAVDQLRTGTISEMVQYR